VEHRTEEGDSVDVDGGRAHVLPDRVHALVVALAQLRVVGVGVGRRQQRGRQVPGGQRLGRHGEVVLVAAVVDPGAEFGVEAGQDLFAVVMGDRRADPVQGERVVDQGAVPVRQLPALVEHIQAHQPEP
jgi:hypothetical protein